MSQDKENEDKSTRDPIRSDLNTINTGTDRRFNSACVNRVNTHNTQTSTETEG